MDRLVISESYDVEKSTFGELQFRHNEDPHYQYRVYYMDNKDDNPCLLGSSRYYALEQRTSKIVYLLTNKKTKYEWS